MSAVIREKYLTPGRVLGRWSDHPDAHKLPRNPDLYDRYGDPVGVWIPCMVISYVPLRHGLRRHARSRYEIMEWDVLVMWMDDRREKIVSVNVPADHDGWKLLW